jgi:hypothetical protein
MQNHAPSLQSGRNSRRIQPSPTARLAIDENALANRWGLSVKTLRRWRQNALGPIFCKMGSRVTYLIVEVEAYERRVSRHSTFSPAYQ